MNRSIRLTVMIAALAASPALFAQGPPSFSQLDTDGNGTLSQKEVSAWYDIIKTYVQAQLPTADAFLKAIDTNGDGIVDQKEFDVLPKAPQ